MTLDLADLAPRCGKCGGPNLRWPKQRYCASCHAAYMREWRSAGRQTETPEQRKRRVARTRAGMALRRGAIRKHPCADCGAAEAEMHHEDYNYALDVTWLCRRCHLARHGKRPAEG